MKMPTPMAKTAMEAAMSHVKAPGLPILLICALGGADTEAS